MAGTPAGAERTAAKQIGVPVDEYARRVDAGEKWCTGCKDWHPRTSFYRDRSRGDGLAVRCMESQNDMGKARYVPVPDEQRRPYGPAPDRQRDGDKAQARGRVNTLVRNGGLPDPDDVPCIDCGHMGDDRRHEYDHYAGYDEGQHELVQSVCSTCHGLRHRAKECIRGHIFDEANTGFSGNGSRYCKSCRRMHDRARAPRGSEHWQKVNARRKSRNYGKA